MEAGRIVDAKKWLLSLSELLDVAGNLAAHSNTQAADSARLRRAARALYDLATMPEAGLVPTAHTIDTVNAAELARQQMERAGLLEAVRRIRAARQALCGGGAETAAQVKAARAAEAEAVKVYAMKLHAGQTWPIL
jgi:hypothetical protein